MPTPNVDQSTPSPSSSKVTFRFGVSLRQLLLKLQRLHLAHSAPSESHSNSASTDVSYCGPVRRNGGAPGTRFNGVGDDGVDDDDDHGDADEIIVDSDLPAPLSSVESRNHSIDGNSIHSTSQGGVTTQDLGDGTWSEYSIASGRVFGFSHYLANARMWIKLKAYMNQTFQDENIERAYQKENWWLRKPLALMAACFILLSWILALALLPRPWTLYSQITYIGVVGFFSLALPIAVIADVPRHNSLPWQILLLFTTLTWPVVFAVEMKLCGFYQTNQDGTFGGGECGNKDFSTMLYYAAVLPIIALFALNQKRSWAALSAVIYIVVWCVTILPDRVFTVRTLVIYFTFEVFLNYMNYHQERLDRKIFLMRDELKRQFRATQRARHLEFKAGDSKKRFVSYIFHEVRVPLNAASLAVQNLAGDGLFEQCNQDQRDVVDALRGSLGMMAKVLNDVLDFNRMEDGKLVVTHNSLDFHKVIRSLLVSARVVAQTRNVQITMQMDPSIDKLQMKKILIGDEMRLRQVMSNLVSNACKFTNPGGSVKIVTELLNPHLYGVDRADTEEDGEKNAEQNGKVSPPPAHETLQIDPNPTFQVTKAIIRLEVHDTGVGIRRQDLIDNRLFSPYVQTDEGRRQGGKGTGLGLALVRHIVKLSGGRLGVKSSRGAGSTFWVEMPFSLENEEKAPSVEYYPTQESNEQSDNEIDYVHSARGTLDRTSVGQTSPPKLKKKRVQIAEESGSDDMSIADIAVLTFPRTEANAEALKETLMDFGRVFSSGAKEAAANGKLTFPSGDKMDFSGDPLIAPSPLGQPPIFPNSGPPSPDTDTCPAPDPINPNISTSTSTNHMPDPFFKSAPASTRASRTSISHNGHVKSPSSSMSPSPSSCPFPTAKANVLIVDDDKITRLLMSRLVSRMGHTIATAEDGAIALRKLKDALATSEADPLGQPPPATTSTDPAPPLPPTARATIPPSPPTIPSTTNTTTDASSTATAAAAPPIQQPFDLVFLDNQMPVMTGVECIREIRRLGIPVWACGVTGNAMIEDQDEFYEAGIDRVLTKPVVEADVKDMIAMALRMREPDYFGRDTWRKMNTEDGSEDEHS
ncbi:hypothetical protein PhCBS80983_g05410 [Powellomyces hirtus]|uniref:histidine kinase n=1 Tax=Powellomyces hirtus TaxID=109895 RepID=A0A507DVV5_9FUNG|nr:hypothetical protein PhCBS80983_g05410 [Powellomyces hirtus]